MECKYLGHYYMFIEWGPTTPGTDCEAKRTII